QRERAATGTERRQRQHRRGLACDLQRLATCSGLRKPCVALALLAHVIVGDVAAEELLGALPDVGHARADVRRRALAPAGALQRVVLGSIACALLGNLGLELGRTGVDAAWWRRGELLLRVGQHVGFARIVWRVDAVRRAVGRLDAVGGHGTTPW